MSLSVAELTHDEAAELGPLLQRTTRVVRELTSPSQVNVCLSSRSSMMDTDSRAAADMRGRSLEGVGNESGSNGAREPESEAKRSGARRDKR